MTQHWVDVSKWQSNIDWAIAAPLIDGAIIKMSEYQEDAQYKENVSGCLDNMIDFAVYHFWHDDVAYKDQFKLIKKLNFTDAPVCLDVEGQSCKLLSNKDRTDRLMALCGELRDAGFTPTIYTRKTIWDVKINKQPIWKTYPLWVANYQVKKPLIPRDWDDWHVWQYSNTGKASIYGCPPSVKYIDQNQVKDEWVKFYWELPVPPVPPAPDTIQASITIDNRLYTGTLTRKDS